MVYFALGALWYAPPLFGNAWMKAAGIVMPEGQRPGPAIYFAPLIADFVAVIATTMLARATGSDTLGEGLVLGLVVGVGFALTMTGVEATFGNRPKPSTWFLINGAYNLLGLVIAAVIVAVWT
ncbi:MAG TPA: DUF1761 domain-containing protein [Actinomycetota bacterium]|jgi:hypothetical protein|nr:DUF1761 domain-containing protein [Actinomycetota bacterium]